MEPEAIGQGQSGLDYSNPDLHLQRLLVTETTEPFVKRFFNDAKEYFFPPKLPPLQVTSKPVAVRSVWGFTSGYGRNAGLSSLLLHGSVVALAFVIGTNERVQQAVKDSVTLIAPDIAPYVPQAAPKKQQMGGGGGGGSRDLLPASKGKLPKAAPRQFVPPQAVVNNPNPKLVMDPTIIVPTDVPLPNVNMAQWGDPFGKVGPPSNGRGSGGGIGDGSGGGVGPGKGAGFGPGEGGGIGGGVYRIGGGVSAPVPVFRPEPEYSEEARKAKYQGVVLLAIVIDDKGNPRDLRVVRPLGLGLDEKAIEAVQKWRFRPGYLNGKPVAVAATVEVNFRLL
jgi:TonB family protein